VKRLAGLGLVSFLLISQGACAHAKRPYSRDAPPETAELLVAMKARYSGLRVPKAKIREGRAPAARLLLLAEAPERMRGTIQVAGNPLVELALNEDGYSLRNLRGQPGLEEGFYHGPPSRCSVRSLLGVDLETAQLVNLLLGGGPLIDGPHEVVSQTWEKGRERLTLQNRDFVQKLEFVWVDGRWWFAGSSLYLRSGDDKQWLWTIRHEELERRSGTVLPTKTQIKRPVPGDTLVLNIKYSEQVVEQEPTRPDSGSDAGQGAETDEGGDEGWEDEGGWEDDDEGWEEEGEVQESSSSQVASTEPAPAPIPAAYLLKAGGLRDRGDLCAGR
jgi:hypothetical protein